MDKEDFEYLKTCVVLSIDKQDIPEDEDNEAHTEYTIIIKSEWWHDSDAVHSVAEILNANDKFNTGDDVHASIENCIDYFQKPWHWNSEIKDLVKEYLEENKIEVK